MGFRLWLEELWLEIVFAPEYLVWATLGSLLGALALAVGWTGCGHASSRRQAVDAAEAELRSEVAQARRALEDHKAVKTKLERDLSAALERGAAQRDAIMKLKEQLVAAQSSETLVALRADLDAANKELQALKAALSEASTKASLYESLLHGLEERAEAQQGELRKQVSLLELSICDLEGACAIRERNLDAAGVKLAAADTRIAMLEAERSVHSEWQERKASGNLTELIEATATISQLAPRCESLQQENCRLLAETRRLESLVLGSKEECAASGVEKRAAINESHRLRAQLLEKSRAIADSHDNFTTLSNRCADLERRLLAKATRDKNDTSATGQGADVDEGGSAIVDVMGILSSPMKPVSDLFSSLLGGTGGGTGGGDGTGDVPDPTSDTPTKLTYDSLHQTHKKLRKTQTPSKGNEGAGQSEEPRFDQAGVLGSKIHEIMADRTGKGKGAQ